MIRARTRAICVPYTWQWPLWLTHLFIHSTMAYSLESCQTLLQNSRVNFLYPWAWNAQTSIQHCNTHSACICLPMCVGVCECECARVCAYIAIKRILSSRMLIHAIVESYGVAIRTHWENATHTHTHNRTYFIHLAHRRTLMADKQCACMCICMYVCAEW